ncbi:MAG: SDR family oxidoreductase [Nitrospinaceae bacterium]
MEPEKVNYHYCDDLSTTPLEPGTRILVTGANGYVGHRLIPELVYRGYRVRCMFRNRRCPPILSHPHLENVYADSLNKDELKPVLKDVHTAFYLIHSMRRKTKEFLEKDKLAAENFVRTAEECGVQRIIYLGGLGEKTPRLSMHLRSRQEVGRILSQSKIPVIKLRAAIIIGAGSASYELLKSLVEHHWLVPFLPEFNSRCQPVAIRDVIKYLVGVLETENLTTRIYHIGGKDVLTYQELIQCFAGILNKKARFIDVSWVPMPAEILCRIYAHWLHFFISIPVNITSLLLKSLVTDVVCRDEEIKKILPFEPLDFKTAVEWALEKERQSRVYSHWSGVPPEKMVDLMPISEYESGEFLLDVYSIDIPAGPEKVFPVVTRIGGDHGWFRANFLWWFRGFLDRMVGGVGLQRGRRDIENLRVGDSVDFFRVERLEPNKELLLRSEMISPGRSWLQFELNPGPDHHTRLILRTHFIPYPFMGHLYWFSLLKFHAFIFNGLLRYFRRLALKSETVSSMEKVA